MVMLNDLFTIILKYSIILFDTNVKYGYQAPQNIYT
jgi:hypothetical protein